MARRPQPPRVLAEGELAVITALRAVGADRVGVYLDGEAEPALVISVVAAHELGLRRGSKADAAAWAEIRRRAQAEAAEIAAARLLAARSRTRGDLARRLRARYAPEAVDAALDRLQSLGYLDDEAFARAWLGRHTGRDALGAPALVAGLIRQGVPEREAKRWVGEHLQSQDPDAAALAVAQAVARRYAALPPADAARRLWAYLQRRGFSSGACYRAVRATLAGWAGEADVAGGGADPGEEWPR